MLGVLTREEEVGDGRLGVYSPLAQKLCSLLL